MQVAEIEVEQDTIVFVPSVNDETLRDGLVFYDDILHSDLVFQSDFLPTQALIPRITASSERELESCEKRQKDKDGSALTGFLASNRHHKP